MPILAGSQERSLVTAFLGTRNLIGCSIVKERVRRAGRAQRISPKELN